MRTSSVDSLRRVFEQAQMVGWDFSRLGGRLVADEPWWDFERDCGAALLQASHAADLGTGGGERLLRLLDEMSGRAPDIIATEGWEPNLAVARDQLAPRGIEVRWYDAERGEPMPFPDEDLDLVMSRHEAIDPREIARVLNPGGRLLTQQVEGHDAEEIHEWFDEEFAYPDVTSERFVEDLEAAGMRMDAVDDWSGTMEFSDAEAFVTYLGLVPWDAPGFTVDAHVERLATLDSARPIQVTQRRFRVYATKR